MVLPNYAVCIISKNFPGRTEKKKLCSEECCPWVYAENQTETLLLEPACSVW